MKVTVLSTAQFHYSIPGVPTPSPAAISLRTIMHYFCFIVLILPLTTLTLADEKPTKAKLLFEDDFSKGAGRWQPSDAQAWID
jgi:hypothetical protein